MATNKSNIMITGQTTLAVTATSVLGVRNERYWLVIKNHDAAINIFVGFSSGVTTANGFLLAAGATLQMEGYTGPVFIIAASGTPVCSTIEW